jgi:hypothetical protein
MSIKRFTISGLHPHIIEDKNGFMVYYEDYARLKAFSDEAQAHIAKEERKSRERLDMAQAEIARLKAEVERLRKAGDAMVLKVPDMMAGCVRAEEAIGLMNVWIAAKEGKPSV